MSLATPKERPLWALAMEEVRFAEAGKGLTASVACARRLAKEASANKPRGLRALSGREWSFGEVGWGRIEGTVVVVVMGGVGEGEGPRRAWVVFWV